MIRNEICRTLNYVDKNFNDLDKVIQAKIALERLEVVDTKLFDRKRFIVSETYKLSDRQEAIMKNLKKIFKKGFLVDLESEDKKDANLISDIYWNIYDFFYDYDNKDDNVYEKEINSIYEYMCLFKSQLNNIVNVNKRDEEYEDRMLEFSLKIESGPVLYNDSVNDSSNRSLINLRRYCEIEDDGDLAYVYEQNINLKGHVRELASKQTFEVERVTKKFLPKLVECATRETYAYISDKIYDGVYEVIAIQIGNLRLSVNSCIADRRIKRICKKYINQLYKIIEQDVIEEKIMDKVDEEYDYEIKTDPNAVVEPVEEKVEETVETPVVEDVVENKEIESFLNDFLNDDKE